MKKVDFVIDGKRYNYDWLTMNDFMGLYSKKHNLDGIYANYGKDEARKYLYGIVDDEYPEVPEKYRMFVFLSLIIASEGKNRMMLVSECDKCQEEHSISFSLNPVIANETVEITDIDGNKIGVKFTALNYRNRNDFIEDLYDGIDGITINGTELDWDIISEETRESIISYFDEETIKNLIKKLIPCSVTFYDAYGCSDIQNLNGVVENDDMQIFDWLINKNEVSTIYSIATIMASNGINMTDYMNMAPFERREILKNIKANNESKGSE